MNASTLQARYDDLKAEATLLAGGLHDIPRRALILINLYLDSGRNHQFSLIAAHGALWAQGYFETGGSLGRFIARRYFYNPTERAYRLALLRSFAEAFRRVNRQVCIDTHANYQFVRRYGREPGADAIVTSELLDALNRVHDARSGGQTLPAAEARSVFEASFRCEQEVTVAPGVKSAVAAFECRIMRFLCLRPIVKFAYFPGLMPLWFKNFADKDERIERGLRAYDLAVEATWPRVERALGRYGVMEAGQLESPEASLADLRATLAREGALAAAAFGRPADVA